MSVNAYHNVAVFSPAVHQRVHNSPAVVHVLSQTDLAYILPTPPAVGITRYWCDRLDSRLRWTGLTVLVWKFVGKRVTGKSKKDADKINCIDISSRSLRNVYLTARCYLPKESYFNMCDACWKWYCLTWVVWECFYSGTIFQHLQIFEGVSPTPPRREI